MAFRKPQLPLVSELKYLCSIYYEDDIGKGFAIELDKRLKEKYPKVSNWLDWTTTLTDTYELLFSKVAVSKHLIFVFTKSCAPQGKLGYCWKSCQEKVLASKHQHLMNIIIKPFTAEDLNNECAIYNPITFEANYLPDPSWKRLLCDIHPGKMDLKEAELTPEKTLSNQWHEFLMTKYDELGQRLDSVNLLDAMVGKLLLTTDEFDEIDAHPTRKKKTTSILNKVLGFDSSGVKEFMNIMKRKEPNAFEGLIKCMPENLKRDYEGRQQPEPVLPQPPVDPQLPEQSPVQAEDDSMVTGSEGSVSCSSHSGDGDAVMSGEQVTDSSGGQTGSDQTDQVSVSNMTCAVGDLSIESETPEKSSARQGKQKPVLKFCYNCGEKYPVVNPKFCSYCREKAPNVQ